MIDRETILRLANAACDKDKVPAFQNGFWTITQDELERFAHLIAAEQKERDARICDELAKKWKPDAERCYTQDDLCASACADAIREQK